jgi:hypothetical protein
MRALEADTEAGQTHHLPKVGTAKQGNRVLTPKLDPANYLTLMEYLSLTA